MDHRDKVVMKDADDIVAYKKSIERRRVHIFLAGLDKVFDQICGEILRKELIPNLEECYFFLFDMKKYGIPHWIIRKKIQKLQRWWLKINQTKNSFLKINNQELTSPHCNQTDHTKTHCFEIIGYPNWWNKNRGLLTRSFKESSNAAAVEIKTPNEKG